MLKRFGAKRQTLTLEGEADLRAEPVAPRRNELEREKDVEAVWSEATDSLVQGEADLRAEPAAGQAQKTLGRNDTLQAVWSTATK